MPNLALPLIWSPAVPSLGVQPAWNSATNQWEPVGVLSAALTDASITVDCGASTAGALNANQFLLYANTLTQNRTITLGIDSAVTQESMTIVRIDTTPYMLAVVNGGGGAGTLYTFPASKKRIATFSFDGSNWSLSATAAAS